MIPRGIRNNNPLNIRRSKDQWQGMKKPQVPPLYHQGDSIEVGTTWREQYGGVHPERLAADGHRPRRAPGHPLGAPRPLDAGRCGHGDSGEWHGSDGLAGDAKRVGEEKVKGGYARA